MRTKPLTLDPPGGERSVLLHVCCAPCSCSIIERILNAGIEPALYFYNPNIHPRDEYEIRKHEVTRYAKKKRVRFFDGDYEKGLWFEKTAGHENSPERGPRCAICFELRLAQAADWAQKNGFKVFTSSLGISRWKDFDQVTLAGIQAASRFPGLFYWPYNWRKEGGSARGVEITREENFYRQRYCGCLYSLQHSQHRLFRGENPSTMPAPESNPHAGGSSWDSRPLFGH
jgi:predicted adenine nucleotide alpha hydrolase (AANH) superfamily ATPase